MDCRHERLRTVGNLLFCKDCGKELPLEYLTGGAEQAKKPVAEAKTDKPTSRKRTPKKAV